MFSEGREPREVSEFDFRQGHPKVRVEADFQEVTYHIRTGTLLGWCWLLFTSAHCAFLFSGLLKGSLKFNGRLVSHPEWGHYVLLNLFYLPVFLIGLALTMARYRVKLSQGQMVVRWECLPCVYFTWRLAIAGEVKVRLAHRGASRNESPVESIVVYSQDKEVAFGAFLEPKLKEYVAAAIRDYYRGNFPTVVR